MSSFISGLRRLQAAATPGPWCDDDGNIFSRPLSDKRLALIMERMDRDDHDPETHPDRGNQYGLGYVGQGMTDEDAALACAAVNALSRLLDFVEAWDAWKKSCKAYRVGMTEQEMGRIRRKAKLVSDARAALEEE